MPAATLTEAPELADEVLTSWLTDLPGDGSEHPAGPLYLGGKFAIQEITMTGGPGSNCSICSGSRPVHCC